MEPNVIKFPKAPVRDLDELEQSQTYGEDDQEEGAERPASKGKRALRAVGRGLRFALFMVMYWLRMPIVGLCSIVSVVMLFATLFAWFAFPDKSNMLWGFGVTSFTSFVIAWCYDFVLMKLSPMPMVDTL